MPHSITCGACKASFSIPDDVWEKRVQGQIATLKCRQCKAPIQVDGRTRKGSPDVAANNTSAPIAQVVAAQLAAPTNVKKEAPTAKDAKPAEAKPQAKVDEPLKKFEARPAAPQAAKAVIDKPKTTGLQPNRAEPKQTEAKLGTAAKSNVEHAKPMPDARAMPATKPHAGTPAPAADAIAQGRKTSLGGIGSQAAAAAKPVFASAPKPKPVTSTVTATDARSSHSDTSDEDLADLWVVSFSVDDDRELDTAQVLEYIARGKLNADTIVWREGMADWLPISQVPQLEEALKAKNAPTAEGVSTKAAPILPQDDGEDETVIYRPGSKAASFMESPTISSAASRPIAGSGISSAEKSFGTSSRNAQGTTRSSISDKQDPGQPAPNVGLAARPPARTTPGVARVNEPSGGKADPFDPQEAPAPVKGVGGPPPLRRQPSRPDESPQHRPSEEISRKSKGHDEVVTSVREFTSGVAPARAGAPPPLPAVEKSESQKEAAAPKPAMFPPAVQPAVTAQTVQAFAPVANAPSLPPTPSFAPRPSDIAALTKIRPKFPKWLPFAVLGGLVVLVAIMAAMSWFRGDNVESKEQKPALDNVLPISQAATKPGTSPSFSQTNTAAADKKPASDGFANSFAQAVAKQRPTGKFDRESAEKALAPAFAKAAGCHNKGEPTGAANLTISISPSGQVLSVTVAPPFTTTFTAECIRNALRDASVPPFQGSPGRLAHSITIH